MKVTSWIFNGNVLVCIESEGSATIIKGIKRETSVHNFDTYNHFFPKKSRSKHDMEIDRKAIEKCWKCKKEKPITEFNAYGIWECPCYDCYDSEGKPKQKFTLPFEIWF